MMFSLKQILCLDIKKELVKLHKKLLIEFERPFYFADIVNKKGVETGELTPTSEGIRLFKKVVEALTGNKIKSIQDLK